MFGHEDPAPTKEEIERIFSKYYLEEYVPRSERQLQFPEYTPTPLNAGPKAITIAEYLKKVQRKESPKEEHKQKKTKRGGKKLQLKKQKRELVRLIGLTHGQEKRELYIKLQKLNGKQRVEKTRTNHNKQ